MDKYREASELTVNRWEKDHIRRLKDTVAEEIPVALVYNGISHAVMLATPADLEDFALGFSLTEGIVESRQEIYAYDIVGAENGIRIELDIASERFQYLKERRRSLTGRTGCGLCGTDSLSQAVRLPFPVQNDQSFSIDLLHSGFAEMEKMQVLKRLTGATHAAAWLNLEGDVSLIREDVGRHNALDKLIGALIRHETDRKKGVVLVTSRASYEMVQKCASAGIAVLAAVSAPTALAVRIADKSNLTLAGFVRENSHTVYTHPDRLI